MSGHIPAHAWDKWADHGEHEGRGHWAARAGGGGPGDDPHGGAGNHSRYMMGNADPETVTAQVELLVTDAGEMEEGLAEELRTQLSKPTLLFAFRNIPGSIDPGKIIKL